MVGRDAGRVFREHLQLLPAMALADGGKYPPGHVLTSEVDFAERNHISRTAYREAIRILAAKGLVESRPKAGTKITDPSRWHILDPDVLAWTFEGEPSQAAIDDLFELRLIIEPAAAEGQGEGQDQR